VFRPDGTVDQSAVDYGAVAALVEGGWGDDAIVMAIVVASPSLSTRHRDERAYAVRAVTAVRKRATPSNSAVNLPTLRPN